MSKKLLVSLPLLLTLGLFAVFAYVNNQNASGRNGADLPSALIGKTAPALNLQPVASLNTPFLTTEFVADAAPGTKLFVLNIWASWCLPCRAEHPYIAEIGQMEGVELLGLNYKDTDENAAAFLGELGNPYGQIGSDPTGRNGIELGVYGVPETFLIDTMGIVRHKFVGPINAERMKKEVIPAIAEITS